MLSKKLNSLQIHYVSSSIYDLQMTIITGHCILLKQVIFSRFYCLTYNFDYAIKPNYISHECRPHTNKKTDWARSLFYCNIENIKECNLNQINASLSPPFVCYFISLYIQRARTKTAIEFTTQYILICTHTFKSKRKQKHLTCV